jgi:hypothetical protein
MYFIQHCFICHPSDSTGKISSTHQSYLCNFVGVVLEAHKRIQVNVHLKASQVTGFENVQEVRYYLLFIFVMFIIAKVHLQLFPLNNPWATKCWFLID